MPIGISIFNTPAAATFIGVVIGVVLLGIGFILGRRSVGASLPGLRKRRSDAEGGGIDEAERLRMLDFLGQLTQWTNQYSGDVSDYQSQLVEMDRSLSAAGTSGENRFLLLLRQIMDNNSRLQSRLEVAEDQLEQQTKQIENYLSEARTDALTGLANRRALDQKLDELFVQYQGGGRGFVICLIDVDHFKKINDAHGHPAGDQILTDVAELLRRKAGTADLVARFGGEEFAIVMKPPLHTAANLANDLRKQIEQTEFHHGGKSIPVTVSMGLSEPREDALIAPVMRRADEALYAAKNVGRNRVHYHDGRRPTLVGAPETVA